MTCLEYLFVIFMLCFFAGILIAMSIHENRKKRKAERKCLAEYQLRIKQLESENRKLKSANNFYINRIFELERGEKNEQI